MALCCALRRLAVPDAVAVCAESVPALVGEGGVEVPRQPRGSGPLACCCQGNWATGLGWSCERSGRARMPRHVWMLRYRAVQQGLIAAFGWAHTCLALSPFAPAVAVSQIFLKDGGGNHRACKYAVNLLMNIVQVGGWVGRWVVQALAGGGRPP